MFIVCFLGTISIQSQENIGINWNVRVRMCAIQPPFVEDFNSHGEETESTAREWNTEGDYEEQMRNEHEIN